MSDTLEIYRPVFIGRIVLFDHLPKSIFFTIWWALALAFAAGFVDGRSWPNSLIPSGLVSFFLVFGGTYFATKYRYRRTTYRIGNDRIEIEEGLLAIQRKSLRLSDVKEVTLHQGISQRAFGLGTIYLATASVFIPSWAPFVGTTLLFGNYGGGVLIRDVENPERLYQRLESARESLVP